MARNEKSMGQESFQLAPEDVKSPGASINFLLLRQLDRLNFLLATNRNENEEVCAREINTPVYLSLYSIENLLGSDVSEEYKSKIKVVKEEIEFHGNSLKRMRFLMEWYSLLVAELPAALKPVMERPEVF